MRPRRKINRGAVIAAIAALGVFIYLIALGINQNAQIPAIKKVVSSYISTYVNYNMLPEQYRTATPDIPQAELDSYIAKMENDIDTYFAAGDSSSQYTTTMLKNNLESQKTDATVVYSYTKEISLYDSFNFDGSTVTVTVDCNASYDGPNYLRPGFPELNTGRVKLNAVTTDTIMLKRVNGEWKVAYADVVTPVQEGGGLK